MSRTPQVLSRRAAAGASAPQAVAESAPKNAAPSSAKSAAKREAAQAGMQAAARAAAGWGETTAPSALVAPGAKPSPAASVAEPVVVGLTEGRFEPESVTDAQKRVQWEKQRRTLLSCSPGAMAFHEDAMQRAFFNGALQRLAQANGLTDDEAQRVRVEFEHMHREHVMTLAARQSLDKPFAVEQPVKPVGEAGNEPPTQSPDGEDMGRHTGKHAAGQPARAERSEAAATGREKAGGSTPLEQDGAPSEARQAPEPARAQETQPPPTGAEPSARQAKRSYVAARRFAAQSACKGAPDGAGEGESDGTCNGTTWIDVTDETREDDAKQDARRDHENEQARGEALESQEYADAADDKLDDEDNEPEPTGMEALRRRQEAQRLVNEEIGRMETEKALAARRAVAESVRREQAQKRWHRRLWRWMSAPGRRGRPAAGRGGRRRLWSVAKPAFGLAVLVGIGVTTWDGAWVTTARQEALRRMQALAPDFSIPFESSFAGGFSHPLSHLFGGRRIAVADRDAARAALRTLAQTESLATVLGAQDAYERLFVAACAAVAGRERLILLEAKAVIAAADDDGVDVSERVAEEIVRMVRSGALKDSVQGDAARRAQEMQATRWPQDNAERRRP